MTNFFELASSRRSIRKFQDTDIPVKDIEDCIKTAVTAPSGCNSQCWKFVVIKNREIAGKIADSVMEKTLEKLTEIGLSSDKDYIEGKKKLATFFIHAPVTIAVFMTQMNYYDEKMNKAFRDKGFSEDEIMRVYSYPNILSIGAAVENLLLALHERGYGACWMNEPTIAGEEVNKILSVPLSHKFISLIPVGLAAYTPRFKQMKPMSDVLEIIE